MDTCKYQGLGANHLLRDYGRDKRVRQCARQYRFCQWWNAWGVVIQGGAKELRDEAQHRRGQNRSWRTREAFRGGQTRLLGRKIDTLEEEGVVMGCKD